MLPYVRRRLVFAHILAASLERERYNRVLVDLPNFLNRSEVLEIAHSFFPRAFSLVIKWDSERHLVLPFVPNDAGYLATFVARQKCVPYECVDDEALVFYPRDAVFGPNLALPDDYWVYSQDLEGFFAPLWSELDLSWQAATPLEKTYTETRAAVIVGHLQHVMATREKVLFVCEYQLWWAVKRILQEGRRAPAVPSAPVERNLPGAFVAEDPPVVWARGYLDDFPAINAEFCGALMEGSVGSFDKMVALNEHLLGFFSDRKPNVPHGASLRRLFAFARYLRGQLAASRRLIPLPVGHLLEGARSCFGKQLARDLTASLLAYPDQDEQVREKSRGFFTLGADGTLSPGDMFDVPDLTAGDDYFGETIAQEGHQSWGAGLRAREEWADLIRQGLTRAELKDLTVSPSGLEWAVEADYRLFERACDLVRQYLSRQARQPRIQRSWGSVGDGIHMKATITARAREDRAIYIKRLRKSLRFARIDEYTPFVFILSPDIDECGSSSTRDANLSQRNIWLGNGDFPFDRYPEPDSVYSLLRAFRESEYAIGGHVRRDQVAALALLYNRSAMGVERYEAIARKPRRYQCRVDPSEDQELRELPLSERIVAWAIKYADSVVIVLGVRGWGLSERLARFAKARRVQVITLPLSVLSEELAERLRVHYHVSTPLKKYPGRDKILRRFVC